MAQVSKVEFMWPTLKELRNTLFSKGKRTPLITSLKTLKIYTDEMDYTYYWCPNCQAGGSIGTALAKCQCHESNR